MVSISFIDYIVDLYDRTGTPVIKFLVQIWALPLPTCLTLNISHDLNFFSLKYFLGFPGGPVVEKTALQCRVGSVGTLSCRGTKTPRGLEWLSPDLPVPAGAAGCRPWARLQSLESPCAVLRDPQRCKGEPCAVLRDPQRCKGEPCAVLRAPQRCKGEPCAPAPARHS